MIFENCPIDGLVLIKPKLFNDSRGYFFETYQADKFKEAGLDFNFVQDNQSLSNKNILRGLHFQNPPYEQGKLVRVIKGAALDVAVDIRRTSPTFGQSYSVQLDDVSHNMLWIPPGFAHGFISLQDGTIFYYKCTGFYNQKYESGIKWNDKTIAIDWGISNPHVSEKDNQLDSFHDVKTLF